MKQSSRAKEFWSMFLLVAGIVIGAGIYLKNKELLAQTGNPIIATALWGVVGLVCIMSVVVFVEISKSTLKSGNGTIGNWSKLFLNRRIASFFAIVYTFVYMPTTQSVFVAGVVGYMIQAIGIELSPVEILSIYLTCCISILALFVITNIYSPRHSKNLQLFGGVFKFIPLIVAMIAGFILWGMGTSNSFNDPAMAENIKALSFLGGFGAILFSFDGYVYIANMQRGAKHPEQVSKALTAGMVFVTIFYILIALATFGGGNGTIEGVLSKIFGGGKEAENVAWIIANIIMMLVCLLSVNMFTNLGMTEIFSDYNCKIIYIPKSKASIKSAALLQFVLTIIYFIATILLGTLAPHGEWQGVNANVGHFNGDLPLYLDQAAYFINSFSSATTVMVFIMLDMLIFGAMINRFTRKVDVPKVKLFWPAAIVSSLMIMVFNIFGIVAFLIPDKGFTFVESNGFIFLLILIFCIFYATIIFIAQEIFFAKKDPFNGFEGVVDENLLTNNWVEANNEQIKI
ncbi:basic amino acid/polyamine antiporter, APA family [Spiroplasma sp. TIUS-1]|uniref:APC family permease n=1 Tax=Spiroplasma sp. TIUS-1 TaxID=216963 RepID=UPI0013976D3B|nr:APC family permease [Spiroplasma sp. TIUS-1]QHX35679.1 basic amino acid/polyamine antiporter, APA family [Spiroplasma sp. TIUS-1]